MNTRPFIANNWFNSSHGLSESEQVSEEAYSNSPSNSSIQFKKRFTPSKFLIPGWTGDSLISKSTIKLRNIISAIHKDSISQLNSFSGFNKSLKTAIFEEFMAFANDNSLNCPELDSFDTLWQHLRLDESPYKAQLDDFKSEYSFKAATVYIFKIKFIVSLAKSLSLELNNNNLINPSSFLTKIFKKGGSTELLCESLHTNQYSWYRPSQNCEKQIRPLLHLFSNVSITELIKICTYKAYKKSEDLYDTSEFSHSLSHKSFGDFTNLMLVSIPKWLDSKKFSKSSSFKGKDILSCKFSGDYLGATGLAHWLAQEGEKDRKSIVCPDFVANNDLQTDYIRIIHELQYLDFLVKKAVKRSEDVTQFVCSIINNKYKNSSNSTLGQMAMFQDYEIKSELSYDRIFMCVSDLPKTNPHHFLLNKISSQTEYLKDDGVFIVMTNQKIFVPSKNNQIGQFLKSFKIEARFNLEDLSHKGEIPSFIYLISKKNLKNNNKLSFNSFSESLGVNKESCLSFRLSGNLSLFGKFSLFVDEVKNFLDNKPALTTPIYQKELSDELSFEFNQDAILEGRLLNLASSDPGKVTHPNFFKNLTKSCIPLSYFFQINSITPAVGQRTPKQTVTTDLLGLKIKHEEQYPFVLIVNQQSPENVCIELIHSDSYRSKLEKYGQAFYQYFGLTPKVKELNINLFRDFFNSKIGLQIIQLSLNGPQTKIKSRLKSMLIPKFFSMPKLMPNHLEKSISFLKKDFNDLLQLHPVEIENKFRQINSSIDELSSKFPWQLASILSHFYTNLENGLFKMHHSKSAQINYSNPLVANPLMKLKTCNIFPSNEEFYIEFCQSNPNSIHMVLDETKICESKDNNYLEIYSNGALIVKIYSDISMVKFLDYLLNSARGVKTSTILSNLKVPSINDLNKVLDNFNKIGSCFEVILSEVSNIITRIFHGQISNPSQDVINF